MTNNPNYPKPACKECEEQGLKYKMFEWNPTYAVIDSGVNSEAYWEEDGTYHPRKTWWTEYYKCSNGHHISNVVTSLE